MCADPGARTPIGASGNFIMMIMMIPMMMMVARVVKDGLSWSVRCWLICWMRVLVRGRVRGWVRVWVRGLWKGG